MALIFIMKHLPIPKLSDGQIRRFWKKVCRLRKDECWLWTGMSDESKGYRRARVSIGPASARHYYNATRVGYYINTGIDPGEKEVCHTCDNSLCINPFHHFLGTQAKNVADMVAKHRHVPPKVTRSVDCPQHKLTNREVRLIRAMPGPQHVIAKKLRTTQGNVSLIRARKTWRHLV